MKTRGKESAKNLKTMKMASERKESRSKKEKGKVSHRPMLTGEKNGWAPYHTASLGN